MDNELREILERMTRRELERVRASCLRHGGHELVVILERHATSDVQPEQRVS